MKGLGLLLFAGCGLGALVGLLLGMSVSPVVSSVLGALLPFAVGFAAWFSKRRRMPASGGSSPAIAYAAVVAVFAWMALGSTCLGVAIRTYGWLSPSPAYQIEQWKEAGFSMEEAKAMAFREAGQESKISGVRATPVEAWRSVLYTSGTQASVGDLTPLIGNATLPKLKEAFVKEGGPLKKAVEYVDRAKLPDDQQRIFLENFLRMLSTASDYE